MKPNVFSIAVGATLCMYTALAVCQVTAVSPGPQDQPVQAQTTTGAAEALVQIDCVVRTQKGVAVPGATVRAVHIPSGRGWVGWTDQDGKVAFSGLPAGQYRLETRQLGLGTASIESEITAEHTAPFEIKLSVTTAPVDVAAAAKTTEPSAANEASAATTPAAAPTADAASNSAESAAKPAHHHHGQAKQTEESAAAATTATTSAPAPPKKKGFEQVETKGQLTASTDVNLDNPLPTVPGGSDQSASTSAYVMSGTIARGANVVGNPSGLDASDSSGDDSESNSSDTGKHSHSGGKHKNAQQSGSNGLTLDETMFNQKMKHLGSNRVRFGFYESYGNSVWDATPFSITDPNPQKLPIYRERFGADAGGPLSIPHLYDGREKTFFFVDYELDRHTNPVDKFATVPTTAERGGDFSAVGTTLYNPYSNIAGPRTVWGTQVPQQYLDSAALGLMKLIPPANLPGDILNYHQQQALPQSIDKVNTRLLHNISPQTTLLAAYNLVSMRSLQSPMYPTLSEDLDVLDQNVTLGVTTNINPRFDNEVRFNFNRSRAQDLSGFAYTNNITGDLGIIGGATAPIDWGAPSISLVNFTGLSDATPELIRNQTFRLGDNLSHYFSRHTLRFGGEVRRRYLSSFVRANPLGSYDFSGLMTSQLDDQGNPIDGTGYDFADFLIGLPDTTTVDNSVASYYGRDWWFVGYVEDDWRIHPRFSLNIGLRYEYITPYTEKYNRLSTLLLNPGFTAVAPVQPGQAWPFGSGNVPSSILLQDSHDLEPRIGIVWRPLNRGPVIRAGYATFYTGSIYNALFGDLTGQPPFAETQTPVTSATSVLTLQNGFPAVAPDFIPNTAAVDPSFKLAYAQIWNMSVEMPISTSTTTEVTYTGTKGTHLELVSAPNSPTPGPLIGADQRRRIPSAGDFNYETAAGNSIYNGVQVRFQRRMAHGLRLLDYYTFSKSIDDTSSIGIGTESSVVQDWTNIAAERGLSSFDIRHQFRGWLTWEVPSVDRGGWAGFRRMRDSDVDRWLRESWIGSALSNWRIAPNVIINSGSHITPLISTLAANPTGALFSQRPDQVCNPTLPAGKRNPLSYINTACFVIPPIGQFGGARRGAITGPGMTAVNLELARRVNIGERYRMDFRVEGQNLFNHPNYTNLVNTVGAAGFGSVTSAEPMRTFDVVVRLHF
jgi:trimeric autotransporter adhesin